MALATSTTTETLALPPAKLFIDGQWVDPKVPKTFDTIDPATADVRARRSSTWRFYDFFWKLHVMDYDDGADFNHPLLITAAGAAIFVAMSGLVLLIIKMRRSLIAWRRRRAA